MNFGALSPKHDFRDYKIAYTEAAASNYLEKYTLPYIPEAKNQGSISSCVAHVAASIEEYFEKIQCNNVVHLSPGYIYGTRYKYKGKGMYLKDALKTLCEKGICDRTRFPYNKEVPEIIELVNDAKIADEELSHCKISRYFKCNTIEDIKCALYTYGPVMISIPWYSDNKLENNIIIKGTQKSCNHALFVWGWDDSAGFRVLNSWGSSWGDHGMAYLPYDYPFNEAWGITDDCTFPHPENYLKDETYIKEPMRNKLLDIIYKILDYIINTFKKITERIQK